jgi:NAD-dependent SIR2 family protein deacetylase
MIEDNEQLEEKIEHLAKLVQQSKYTVFFTGAGVSTSAGISDYRGPSGCWTARKIKQLQQKKKQNKLGESELQELEALLSEQKKEVKKSRTKKDKIDAQPSLSHMSMATLINKGLAHYVVTTNLDGLHRKSGLQAHKQICNLHGCIYAERCTNPDCGREYERNYNTRRHKNHRHPSASGTMHVHDHHVATCDACGSAPPENYNGKPKPGSKTGSGTTVETSGLIGTEDVNVGTKDTHINFGEHLDTRDWNESQKHCSRAELCIVAGTSMSLRHVTHFPFMADKTVIINLQSTPDDSKCLKQDNGLCRIWAKTDDAFGMLMGKLNVEVEETPVWRPTDSLSIHEIKMAKGLGKQEIYCAVRLEHAARMHDEQQKELRNDRQVGASAAANGRGSTTAEEAGVETQRGPTELTTHTQQEAGCAQQTKEVETKAAKLHQGGWKNTLARWFQ